MYTPFQNTSFELSILSKDLQNDFGFSSQRRQVLRCNNCGTIIDDFLDSGFVGCSECYNVFKDYAMDFAKDIHGSSIHRGRVPKKEETKAVKKRELEKLIREKEIAVAKEEYRRADELKSMIQRLREEL